jgi:hypothetical protein
LSEEQEDRADLPGKKQNLNKNSQQLIEKRGVVGGV